MIKKILTENPGYKILALILAIVLWMGVIDAEDPVISRDFSNVTVTEKNADVITGADKAYSYVDGINTVSVRVSGRTSIVNRVTREDIVATVDLSKLSDTTGAVPVDVSCDRYPSLDVSTEGSTGILRIEIEDLDEKALNVQVETSGSPPSGKFVGKGVAAPNLVTVSGPHSIIENINGALVRVSVSEQSTGDIITNTDLILVDKSGREVDSSSLSISETSISVSVPIYNTKTLPLELNVKGELPEGYELDSFEYEPKQLTVAGPDEELESLNSLVLEDYDISGSTGRIEESLAVLDNLKNSLPSGVALTNAEATVALAVDIEKSGEESFNLNGSQIELKGRRDGISYEISGSAADGSIPVTVRGTPTQLEKLSQSKINASLDVSELDEGEYDLKLNVELEGSLSLVSEPQVHVRVYSSDQESTKDAQEVQNHE